MSNDKPRCEKLTAAIGEWVITHPGKIVLGFVLVTILMAVPLRNLDTSTKLSDYLPECEYLQADEKLREEFNAAFTITSVLQAESGNILDREGLAKLVDIEDAILSSEELDPYLIDYDDAVVSVADAVEAVIFSLSNGLYGLDDAPDDVLEEAIEEILDDENIASLVSNGSSQEREYAIILVRFNHNKMVRDDETAELALLEAMNGAISEGYKLTSLAARNYHMERDAKADILRLGPISLGLVCLVLIIALRSVVDFLVCIVGLASTMIISFGAFSLFDLQFSQITFFAPIVIMILAIDYAIHLLHRYNEYRNKGLEPAAAISNGIHFMGVSILFSAATTVLAFGSNGLSKIPAVSSFGWFLAMGISVSFVVMILFVPALKLLGVGLLEKIFGPRTSAVAKQDGTIQASVDTDCDANKSQEKQSNSMSAGEGRILKTLHLGVIVIALGLCAVGLFLAKDIKRDMDSKDVCAKDSPILITQEIINDDFSSVGMDRAKIIIEADICQPEVLRAISASIRRMDDGKHVAKLDEKAKITSIIPHIKETTRLRAKTLGLTDADSDRLPDTREGIVAVLNQLYDKGLAGVVSEGTAKSLLSRDGPQRPFDMVLLVVETHDTHGTNSGKLLAELKDDLKPLENIDGVKIGYAGFVFERYEMITEMTEGMNRSTIVSIILCTVVVVLLFRSIMFGLITALPVVLITGWILGGMYLFDFTLNMITATITAMSIGLGIDYSIHLVERYRQERRTGLSAKTSMRKSLRSTGPSLLAAAGTTVSGFVVMAFGRIGMIHSFGILATLAIIYALIGTVVVLPVMLVGAESIAEWLKKRRSR